MEKIGVIGGTFDPVHKGHIRLGYAALESCGLENVTFIPAACPPHKENITVSSFCHRRKMLEIAVAEEDRFSVSDMEAGQDIPSYTYLTLRKLKETMADKCINFIIGSDAFVEIESWKNWREVIANTNFIIAVRPGLNLTELHLFLNDHGFSGTTEKKWKQRNSKFSIEVLKSDFADISSTDIRTRIENNEEWERLLPRRVVEYIKLHKLYYSQWF